MTNAPRRQILSDIGITLWRLRVSEDDPAGVSAAPGSSRSGDRSHEEDNRSHIRDRSHSEDEKPWSVLSLALGETVLLVDGESSRRDLRLAQDILAAAAGDWRGRPVSRRFRWPPEVAGGGLQPAADGGRRALHAFVDKDIGDHGARLLVCTEALAALVEDAWPGCRRLTVPALDVLGREPDAKRALWGAIGERG